MKGTERDSLPRCRFRRERYEVVPVMKGFKDEVKFFLRRFIELNRTSGADLWTMSVESNGESLRAGKPEILLQTPFNERTPAFSPDGVRIAYSSGETGTLEVYVREYPDKGGEIQISNSRTADTRSGGRRRGEI
jgi:WD40-like Beta Propeller Repeat